MSVRPALVYTVLCILRPKGKLEETAEWQIFCFCSCWFCDVCCLLTSATQGGVLFPKPRHKSFRSVYLRMFHFWICQNCQVNVYVFHFYYSLHRLWHFITWCSLIRQNHSNLPPLQWLQSPGNRQAKYFSTHTFNLGPPWANTMSVLAWLVKPSPCCRCLFFAAWLSLPPNLLYRAWVFWDLSYCWTGALLPSHQQPVLT